MSRRRVAVVLAAGQGKRMGSDLPKVLLPAAGRPLLAWVLDAAREAGCERLVVVVGHRAEAVREAFADAGDVTWALQERQLGTGHALARAAPAIDGAADLLVLSGDAPLVESATLEALADAAGGGWGALAVADLDEPGSLGRVVPRADDPRLLDRIVEAADAGPAELAIPTVNAGVYVLPAPEIFDEIERLGTDNAQGEIYLTDALGRAAARGERVVLHRLDDPSEALGANTPEELEDISRRLARRHSDCTARTTA